MKKLRNLIIVAAITALFISCSSSKQQTVEADSYDDGDGTAVSSSKKSDKTKSNTTQKKKKSGFNIANLFASKFYEYDQTTLFSEGTFGGIKQQNANLIYYQKTGNVGFGSPIMAAYYYLTFDANARNKLEKAVNQYLSDFENKKLNRKAKKTYKSYGTLETTMYWGTVKTSSPNNAKATANLGYGFEKNSPYFKITIYPTDNSIYTGPDSNAPEKSIMINFYFTKAQAQALVNSFKEERVAEVIREYEIETYGLPEDIDYYDDSDEYDDSEDFEETTETVAE